MGFWESINQALNSDISINIASIIIVIFVFIGILVYADIQIKDRVLIVDILCKNKSFNYKKLSELFSVQAIVVTAISIILMFMLLIFKELMYVFYLIIMLFIALQVTFSILIIRYTKKTN